jgi:hypothetical protein
MFDGRPTTIAELRAAGLATTAADVRKAALEACKNDRQRKIILSGRETGASAITPCIWVPWPEVGRVQLVASFAAHTDDPDFWVLDGALRMAGISTARTYNGNWLGPMTWRLSFFACRKHEDCRKNHDTGRACLAAWTRIGAR